MNDRPRCQWFCFSLRTLLVCVVVLAVPLAWVCYQRMESRRQAAVVAEFGQRIVMVEFVGPLCDIRFQNGFQSDWSKLVEWIVGRRVLLIHLYQAEASDLIHLASLTNLQQLTLQSPQTSDLTALATLKDLRSLDLLDAHELDLSPLVALGYLQELSLRNSHAVDLAPLGNLTNLNRLDLRGVIKTDGDVEKLQEMLRRCRISCDPPKPKPQLVPAPPRFRLTSLEADSPLNLRHLAITAL